MGLAYWPCAPLSTTPASPADRLDIGVNGHHDLHKLNGSPACNDPIAGVASKPTRGIVDNACYLFQCRAHFAELNPGEPVNGASHLYGEYGVQLSVWRPEWPEAEGCRKSIARFPGSTNWKPLFPASRFGGGPDW